MIDYENLRSTVAQGLKKYLGCPVIRSNQNAEPPPFPYLSYTVTTLMSENNGTYGEYEDGIARKPVTSRWSITALSDDNIESVTLANKAREWLDYVGTVQLNANNVIVQSVGSVTNRDNILSTDYECRNGFDVVFWMFDEVKEPETGTIETIFFNEDYGKHLENRLDGVTPEITTTEYWTSQNQEDEELAQLLGDRLDGV